MTKTAANSDTAIPITTAATFGELQRMLTLIEDKLEEISSDAERLVKGLRGHDPFNEEDIDPSAPGVGGDLDCTFNRARRIFSIVLGIEARTSFATKALTDRNDDVEDEGDDEVVESARDRRIARVTARSRTNI